MAATAAVMGEGEAHRAMVAAVEPTTAAVAAEVTTAAVVVVAVVAALTAEAGVGVAAPTAVVAASRIDNPGFFPSSPSGSSGRAFCLVFVILSLADQRGLPRPLAARSSHNSFSGGVFS